MPKPKLTGLLVRAQASAMKLSAAETTLKAATAPLRSFGFGSLEPLFDLPGGSDADFGIAETSPARWFRSELEASTEPSPWDVAHEAAASSLGLSGSEELYIEPDLEQVFLSRPESGLLAAKGGKGSVDPPDPALPFREQFAWFLDEDFSQLRSARREVGDPGEGNRVRIAHLDTGYDETHETRPPHLLADLQRNFVRGETPNDARDPGRDTFGPLDNPGHGTGTLGLLAGGRVEPLDDFLGGAPQAEIVPVRIAKSVVLLRTGALAKALDYVSSGGPGGRPLAEVVSLSMGGVASRAWADAVNKAYEAGVCIVAAAGNNFSSGLGGVPTHFVVFPARFHRVIAACGVMANTRPYYGLPFGKMQGNWGPASKMATAISAFTPNVPWAELGSQKIIDLNGAGTSSATPQIAAAVALWLTQHRGAMTQYAEPWQRVEAVRNALFRSAQKTADGGKIEKLGNGILQASRALTIPPAKNLARTPRDFASFAFLRVLTGLGLATPSAGGEMLAVEASQLSQQGVSPGEPSPFEEMVPDPGLPPSAIPSEQVRRFLGALIEHPLASKKLQEHLRAIYKSRYAPPSSPMRGARRRVQPSSARSRGVPKTTSVPLSKVAAPTPRPQYVEEPAFRRLRGYASDPSLAQRLSTSKISAATFTVPWEPLEPGPVGEYVEVVDYDPGSQCFYEPVDLNDPALLAQQGLPPSEGIPQFHQQMVYAVASMTIHNFERALGRKTLWAPGPPPEGANKKDDSHFVRKLRIYPHALRTANAYYSPVKMALLFGYYPASDDDPGDHMPGGMIFTCLSHDIVAHETTHALLDGMHRRLICPSNPDVLAFHEAFADIVALLQHFSLREVVRHQIAQTKGDIRSHQNLLGEMAGEFGRTTGAREALRSAIGQRDPETGEWRPYKADPGKYQNDFEAHRRGAILIAAVFDAFLSIYESRVCDLLRLATGGSGVLQSGAIPPDLVNRLSDEAGKSANHVLAMCVRALDYCPPVDLTFGEYLRAIITADHDVVPDDDQGYRVAFVEAFRRRGLHPRGLRTLSEESLRWRRPIDDAYQPSQQLRGGLEKVRNRLRETSANGSREQIFHLARELRRDLHGWLHEHMSTDIGRRDARFLGLDSSSKFEVHSLRVAHRVGPDGDLLHQIIIDVLQERKVPLSTEDRGGPKMTVEGGCTIVADLERLEIDYCIRKSATSPGRLARQREFVAGLTAGSLYATYFGSAGDSEPIARLHAGA